MPYNHPLVTNPRTIFMMRLRKCRNSAVATAIGLTSGVLCWTFLHRFHLGAADFAWAYFAAKALLAGVDPYVNTRFGTVPYPLPAAIVAMPLTFFSPETAAALFF